MAVSESELVFSISASVRVGDLELFSVRSRGDVRFRGSPDVEVTVLGLASVVGVAAATAAAAAAACCCCLAWTRWLKSWFWPRIDCPYTLALVGLSKPAADAAPSPAAPVRPAEWPWRAVECNRDCWTR